MLASGQSSRQCYLPGTPTDVWYNAATGSRHAGGAHVTVPVTLADMPVFIRGGSIIPRRERPRRSSAAMVNDPYTLVVALDAQGRAEGVRWPGRGELGGGGGLARGSAFGRASVSVFNSSLWLFVPEGQSSWEKHACPFATLPVCGAKTHSPLTPTIRPCPFVSAQELYLDDGISNEFRDKNAFRVIAYEFADGQVSGLSRMVE